ncbi:MAG: hypothetical protein HRT71_02845 [Flavobacteriales bacterium]|nr:hypothetical protein [Flavobacteriales bacterium]
MKNIYPRLLLTLALLITLTSSTTKNIDSKIDFTDLECNTCNKKSATYIDKYQLQEHYAPYADVATKTIKIALHFWQNDSGGGNWNLNDSAHVARLHWIENSINKKLRINRKPSHPVRPVSEEIRDLKLQIEFVEMYAYQEEKHYRSRSISSLNNYVRNSYQERINNIFPIHITNGKYGGAAGMANMATTNVKSKNAGIVTFASEHNPSSDYAWASHLLHELGHNFGLKHTYKSGLGGGNETTYIKHQDFLWDVFGASPGIATPNGTPKDSLNVCYHDGYFRCDYKDPSTTCTNNLMGGTGTGGYTSVLQAGRMHKALALTNMRRYIKGDPYSEVAIEITTDEKIDFNLRLFKSVIVKSGATLTITCKLYMPNQGNIVVEKGGNLIVAGLISSEVEGNYGWEGNIIVNPGGKVYVLDGANIKFTNDGKIVLNEDNNIKGTIEYASSSIEN